MTPDAARALIVRLGRLRLRDFLLVEPKACRVVIEDAAARADLSPALANAPDVELHLSGGMGPMGHIGPVPLSEIRAAQARLVRRFALLLLKHKAPPLYDCLSWHELDLSHALKSIPMWKTRVLLAGEGAISLMLRFPRAAGVTVIEPLACLRRYAEERTRLDRIRRVRAADAASDERQTASPSDLAVITSGSELMPPDFLLSLACSCPRALVVENCPLGPSFDRESLAARGFTPLANPSRETGAAFSAWQRGAVRA